jgi:hypothetical protein
MSQRECAGFNWPPLSISAVEPVSISPEAISRAGAFGLQYSTVFRLLSLFPAALFPFCAGVPAIGVGQPANVAVWPRLTATFRPSGVLPVTLNPLND